MLRATASSVSVVIVLSGCSGLLSLDQFRFQENSVSGGASSVGGFGTTIATGGASAAPTATGGQDTATGGAATGGAATGGAATGGAATGGAGLVLELGATDETVYIHTPDRNCGGGLMTNGWVLTANSCVDCGCDAGKLSVQYRSQVSKVSEIVRYPEGDCMPNAPSDARDVLLLRLESPMVIDNSEYGYRRNTWPEENIEGYLSTVVWNPTDPPLVWCRGWYAAAGGALFAQESRRFIPSSFKLDSDVVFDTHNIGDLYWLMNDTPSQPERGRIFVSADIGSACWIRDQNWRYFLGIYTPAAPKTSDPQYFESEQVRISSAVDLTTQKFIDRSLYSSTAFGGFTAGSAITPAAVSRRATDYYWISNSNHLMVRRRQDETIGNIVDLGVPPNKLALVVEKPSALIHDATLTSIWVRDVDNSLWVYLRPAVADPTWLSTGIGNLAHSVTPVFVDSLVQLITRDSTGLGMFAKLNASLQLTSSWQYIPDGKTMTSDFAAGIGRIYARGDDNWVYALWNFGGFGGSWEGGTYYWGSDVNSDVAVAAWDFNTTDVFYLNNLSHIAHKWLDYHPHPRGLPVDLRIPALGASLAATTSGRGSMEIVSRIDDENLQVVRCPR